MANPVTRAFMQQPDFVSMFTVRAPLQRVSSMPAVR
jgi:hypothetical protein